MELTIEKTKRIGDLIKSSKNVVFLFAFFMIPGGIVWWYYYECVKIQKNYDIPEGLNEEFSKARKTFLQFGIFWIFIVMFFVFFFTHLFMTA